MKKEIEVNNLIIELFNKSLVLEPILDFKTVNEKAVKYGYLIHPNVCSMEVLNYVLSKKTNYNSTFYTKWTSIINKSRFELLIDQLLHYASTYGSNFTGTTYIPEILEDVPPFTEFKVIGIIGKDEVCKRCEEILSSGVALSQDIIERIFKIINFFNYKLKIENTRNREVRMILHKTLNIMPDDPVEMVRFLIYTAIGKTMIIKDKETIMAIKASGFNQFNSYVKAFGLKKLSSVFNRFKPIFLAFKNDSTKNTINILSKFSKKNHVPMKKGFFEFLLNDNTKIDLLSKKKLEEISNFKKVLLLQTINKKLKKINPNAYVIRNQKLWIRTEPIKYKIDEYKMLGAYYMIYESLIESLKKKACKISLPKNIELALPISEKSFIGNFPLGTYFDLSDTDAIVGINWKGSEARDIDLSTIDLSGAKTGWNSRYYNNNNSLIFSGDMTYADPEATELFYAKNGFGNEFSAILKANVYSNEDNPKLKLFLATEKIVNLHKNYMVNPNNVLFTIDITMDSREKAFGVLTNNKFIPINFRTGRGRVSTISITDLYTQYAIDITDTYIPLKKVLTDAGFIITDDNPDIDLKQLSVDSLISLLS